MSAPKGSLRFRDRDPRVLGAIGIVVSIVAVTASFAFTSIPFLNGRTTATAYVADAAGLNTGDTVYVAGIDSGRIRDISLEDGRVKVDFEISRRAELGEDTSAQIKTDSILGRRALAVSSTGRGDLHDMVIPQERTTTPYSLTSALGDLTDTVEELDTDSVDEALDTLSETMSTAGPEVQGALDGVTRLSRSLNTRDEALRELLAQANDTSEILGERSQQINQLMVDGNRLFTELDMRKRAISELANNVTRLSQELSGVVQDNEAQLGPALDNLEQVSDMLIRNREDLDMGLRRLSPFATALGEAVASGPWFNAYVSNLGQPQYWQQWTRSLAPLLDNEVDPMPPAEYEPTVPPYPNTEIQSEWPGWGEENR